MKKKISVAFISLWVCAITLAGAYMHGSHLISFDNSKINQLKFSKNSKSWGMIHILGEGCGCSEIIAEHLIKRKAKKDFQERVFFIGNFPQYENQLKKVGFSVEKNTDITKYLEGLPMLIVHNQAGEVKYSGGYAQKMITPITKILDEKIFESVKNNTATEQLLVAGCAVSKELQKQIDPLGLKYN